MDKKAEKPVFMNWLNKNVWGKDSIIEEISDNLSNRSEVPIEAIETHKNLIAQLEQIEKFTTLLESPEFFQAEFIKLRNIDKSVQHDEGSYRGLKASIKLLEAGIKIHKDFINLVTTEGNYRSFKQQEMYNFVQAELDKTEINKDSFLQAINNKFNEILSEVKTDKGKQILELYYQSIKNIAKSNQGIQLLVLLKKNQIDDVSFLKHIANIVENFEQANLPKTLAFTQQAQQNQEHFDKFALVVNLSKQLQNCKNYGLMLEYLAYKQKYQEIFPKFRQLQSLLQEWQRLTEPLEEIRRKYNDKNYKKVKEFSSKIPGSTIYKKYQEYC